jgi:hypothetical protein
MATSKKSKTTPKTTIRTNFFLVHEPMINGGHYDIVRGWLGASQEAMKMKLDASKYAKASISSLNSGEAKWKPETIRQNVTAGIKVLKKYKTIDNAITVLEREYALQACWARMKEMVAGDGQRAKKSKPKQFDAKREAKKYTKAQLKAMYEAK